MCVASDEMTVSDEYRVKAAAFRAHAERERDPLFRSMYAKVAKTYSRLAKHAEENERKGLTYEPSPPIAALRSGKR